VPFSSVLSQWGGWQSVFNVASGLAFLSAFLALFVLKPMRARQVAASRMPVAAPAPGRVAQARLAGGR
jgi:predicted MFS family arabinose efflux permease